MKVSVVWKRLLAGGFGILFFLILFDFLRFFRKRFFCTVLWYPMFRYRRNAILISQRAMFREKRRHLGVPHVRLIDPRKFLRVFRVVIGLLRHLVPRIGLGQTWVSSFTRLHLQNTRFYIATLVLCIFLQKKSIFFPYISKAGLVGRTAIHFHFGNTVRFMRSSMAFNVNLQYIKHKLMKFHTDLIIQIRFLKKCSLIHKIKISNTRITLQLLPSPWAFWTLDEIKNSAHSKAKRED